MRVTFLIILSLISLASSKTVWTHKGPSYCNFPPAMWPFSGFKISRQYRIGGVIPKAMHFLTITYCNRGSNDNQIVYRTQSSSHLDWDRPFCLFNPRGGRANINPADEIRRLTKQKSGEVFQEDNLETSIPKNLGPFKLAWYWMEKELEDYTKGKRIEYVARSTRQYLNEVEQADPQVSLEWEARNLVCFKMARRKKYAHRPFAFYLPQTFVGGLFECPLLLEDRKRIFMEMKSSDIVKPVKVKCDSTLARPILPLMAEDSTSHWFKIKFNSVTQTIPFLSTTTPFNIRFLRAKNSDIIRSSWATEIEVNEEYSYNNEEKNIISMAIEKTTDYLNQLVQPMDLEKVISTSFTTTRKHHQEDERLGSSQIGNFSVHDLSLDHLTALFFSTREDEKETLIHLDALQKIWDLTVGF